MQVGIPGEILPGEQRVSAVPTTVSQMIAAGFEVVVETGAGQGAGIEDADYAKAGARIADTSEEVLGRSDIILKVNRLMTDATTGRQEIHAVQEGAIVIGTLQALRFPDSLPALNAKNITAFSLDCLPRIARAQAMDVLSSMSNIAGYESVILAAKHLKKFFPMLTTAAGSIPPAKVVVIGAGVAGLQAIATARRLGAMVVAFDPRPVVEEQVKSLGANFVPMAVQHDQAGDTGGYARELSADFYRHEQEILRPFVQDADVVITTALIPGKPAPILLTECMISAMKPGSVVVDLAIEQGGNCALSVPGETVTRHGVTLVAETNMPSLLAVHASQLYAKNIVTFLLYAFQGGDFPALDLSDEIISGALITHKGRTVHQALPERETQS